MTVGPAPEMRRAGLALTRDFTRGGLQWLEGTHLFPLEDRPATSAAVPRPLEDPP